MRCYFNDFVRLSFSSHPIVEKERILRINLFLSWSIFEALHQGDSSSSLSHLIDVYAVLVCHSTGGGWHLLPLHEDRGTSCLPSKALGKSQTFQVGKTTHGFWSGCGVFALIQFSNYSGSGGSTGFRRRILGKKVFRKYSIR